MDSLCLLYRDFWGYAFFTLYNFLLSADLDHVSIFSLPLCEHVHESVCMEIDTTGVIK
jgi:hypothetical protein